MCKINVFTECLRRDYWFGRGIIHADRLFEIGLPEISLGREAPQAI